MINMPGGRFTDYYPRSFNAGRYNYRLYPGQNLYQSQNNISQNNAGGFMRIHVIDQVTGMDVDNATITIYVTDGARRDIPVMHLITILNPIRIELPMANVLGTQIVGPEYDFSTYNLRVDAFGYFANILYNIRLFPDITTDFSIELVPVTQPQVYPAIEERIDIPPHPRDIIIE
mgnify:CR=1 FL=1